MKTKYFSYILILVLVSGCAVVGKIKYDEKYGTPNPALRSEMARSANKTDKINYHNDVRPILEKRCAACHGCYDAPCQLKLTSYEGLERGGTTQKVYDAARLTAAPMTRLFLDASTAEGWREKGFHPVLNERTPTPEANLQLSLLYKLLELKNKNPLPQVKRLPDSFDFRLLRDEQCPSIEEFDKFAKDYPLWGMPYGLPGLEDKEFNVLKNWIEQGAPYSSAPELSQKYINRIISWEKFLNGSSNKQKLMSRYIYEHLFLAHFYFEDLPVGEYFELVRSKTPIGEPIEVIATRRVTDDPGVKPFYYRLQRNKEVIIEKTHMPYALNNHLMIRWTELFLKPNYEVSKLPSYDVKVASNPFITFKDIPEASRYKFMLDEAQFTVMGFIKGPVCRGQLALDVINDQFWVVFENPDLPIEKKDQDFVDKEAKFLGLPAKESSNTVFLTKWLKYSKMQRKYLKARNKFIKKNIKEGKAITLDLIWDGDGKNQNAALTIFRHFDSASVVKGFVGDKPKTAWYVRYPLLERIHYLLVAGYDPYGNYGHQLLTRLYMDFMRMEGESYFLALLPPQVRAKERDFWYRGAEDTAKKYVLGMDDPYGSQIGITYLTADPKSELFDKLKTHLSGVLNYFYDLERNVKDKEVLSNLQRLASIHGRTISGLPQTIFMEIPGEGVFTILPNSGHSNISSLIDEKGNRLPEEDTLTVANGFIGAYPNLFLKVEKVNLSEFVDEVSELDGEKSYRALLDKYAIRRTDSRFWAMSDSMNESYKKLAPIEAGLFDLNRLENR